MQYRQVSRTASITRKGAVRPSPIGSFLDGVAALMVSKAKLGPVMGALVFGWLGF